MESSIICISVSGSFHILQVHPCCLILQNSLLLLKLNSTPLCIYITFSLSIHLLKIIPQYFMYSHHTEEKTGSGRTSSLPIQVMELKFKPHGWLQSPHSWLLCWTTFSRKTLVPRVQGQQLTITLSGGLGTSVAPSLSPGQCSIIMRVGKAALGLFRCGSQPLLSQTRRCAHISSSSNSVPSVCSKRIKMDCSMDEREESKARIQLLSGWEDLAKGNSTCNVLASSPRWLCNLSISILAAPGNHTGSFKYYQCLGAKLRDADLTGPWCDLVVQRVQLFTRWF